MDLDDFERRLQWSEVRRRMAWMEENKFVGEDGKTYYRLPPIKVPKKYKTGEQLHNT